MIGLVEIFHLIRSLTQSVSFRDEYSRNLSCVFKFSQKPLNPG